MGEKDVCRCLIAYLSCDVNGLAGKEAENYSYT